MAKVYLAVVSTWDAHDVEAAFESLQGAINFLTEGYGKPEEVPWTPYGLWTGDGLQHYIEVHDLNP